MLQFVGPKITLILFLGQKLHKSCTLWAQDCKHNGKFVFHVSLHIFSLCNPKDKYSEESEGTCQCRIAICYISEGENCIVLI